MIPSISFEPLGIVFGSWRPYWLDILCGFVRKLATPFHPLVYHSCSSPCSVPNMTCQKKLPWPAMTWGILPILIILQICLLTSFTMAIHGPSQRPKLFPRLQRCEPAAAVDDGPKAPKAQSVFSVLVWGIQPKNQWKSVDDHHFSISSHLVGNLHFSHSWIIFSKMANKWPTLAFLDVSHFGTPLVT